MKAKMKIKMGIDFLMTVLLFLLMSYQITGQELHERSEERRVGKECRL